jgi:hypothetical protein
MHEVDGFTEALADAEKARQTTAGVRAIQARPVDVADRGDSAEDSANGQG